MKDDDRKLLTEFLGEIYYDPCDIRDCNCSMQIPHLVGEHENRTFHAPDDFFAVFGKLVKKDEWVDFYMISIREWNGINRGFPDDCPSMLKWFLGTTPEGDYRLCELAVEYLKGKEKVATDVFRTLVSELAVEYLKVGEGKG